MVVCSLHLLTTNQTEQLQCRAANSPGHQPEPGTCQLCRLHSPTPAPSHPPSCRCCRRQRRRPCCCPAHRLLLAASTAGSQPTRTHSATAPDPHGIGLAVEHGRVLMLRAGHLLCPADTRGSMSVLLWAGIRLPHKNTMQFLVCSSRCQTSAKDILPPGSVLPDTVQLCRRCSLTCWVERPPPVRCAVLPLAPGLWCSSRL